MDKKSFELKMKKFFEKAGVTLLEKGNQYNGGEEVASYMLLDNKRKSFYLMETDVFDEGDSELDAITDYFVTNYGADQPSAKAILRLGRAGLFYDDDFTIEGCDLAALIRKSAFVISEKNAQNMGEFLKKRAITFQAVPFKGSFLVMFLDRNNSKKIAGLYHRIADEYLKVSSGQILNQPETGSQLMDEIEQVVKENQILFDIDNDNSDIFNKPQEEHIHSDVAVQNQTLFDIDKNDASFSHKPIEPLKETDIHEAMKFGANGYQDHELGEKKIKPYYEPVASNSNPETSATDDKLVTANKKTNSQPSATSKVVTSPPESAVRHLQPEKDYMQTAERIFNKIWDNFAGILFFLPAYIIYKISFKKLPAFSIYFLSTVAVFFGLYQFILTHLGDGFYKMVFIGANKAGLAASGLAEGAAASITLENVAALRIMGAVTSFFGEIYFINYLKDGFLLKYLLFIGGIFMIFPFSRRLGAKLTIFFILLYITLPILLYIQSWTVNVAVYGGLDMVKYATESKNTSIIYSVVSSCIFGAVYIAPIILVWICHLFSNFANPFKKDKPNEVLP